MCVQIDVEGVDELVETQGALSLIVGGADGLRFEYGEFHADACLCPVDVRATLEAKGFTVENGWEKSACDWIARRSSNQGGS